MVTIFEQGDAVYLDSDPQFSHEQSDRRPVLVISNNLFNRVSGLTIVCPITRTDWGHPFHLRLGKHTRTDGTTLCDQARISDSNSRHAFFVERAPEGISSEAVDMVIGSPESEQRKKPRKATSSVAAPHLVFESAGRFPHGHRPCIPGPCAPPGAPSGVSYWYADEPRWHRRRAALGRRGSRYGIIEGHIG